MNCAEQKKRHNMEKQMPGCMGMVVNLFDLGPNISGNRLLTEKAHQERCPPSRALPDGAKKFADPVDNRTKDDCSPFTLKGHLFNRKSNGTPMKMLIAQEMLMEPDSKLKSPSVVARLMGLDAFPPQGQAEKLERFSPSRYSQSNARKYEAGPRNWQQGNNFVQSSAHETQDFKDVYEVRHQSPKASHTKVMQKVKQNNDLNEKIAFVRQKFMEAKRLSVDDKLRQSKQFQDVLDALSSNRDAFLKFLQEPNSLLSTHLYELPYVAPLTERKRITVLKPAKATDVKGEKTMKKQLSAETNGWNKGHSKQSGFNVQHKGDNNVRPTRIVVLKPSPGKNLDIKSFSSPASPQRSVHGRDRIEGYGIDDSKESREIAKEITWQMRKRLSKSCGDDSFFSSALSNEYFGDQSSLNKSNYDYEEENFSDSGMVTPNSRHSWDYINKFGSPFSSSVGRASYSPESSVSKEAKKRLLERRSLIESNGNETHQVHRKSSTLGEMLSLPEAKMSIQSGNEAEVSGSSGYCNKFFGEEQDHGLPSLCLSNVENKDECMNSFPRNLVRSRSAPLSSNMHETCGSNIEILEYKNSSPKETTKPKSGKSSIKGKVSSFLFSINKKSDKTRSGSTPIIGTQDVLRSVDISNAKQVPLASKHDDNSTCSSTRFDNERVILHVEEAISETSSSLRHESLSREDLMPLAKTGSSGQYGGNQEQPSPISVLDAPFNEEVSTTRSGENVDMEKSSNLRLLKSCEATTKSPLIESVTRSLTWDDRALETLSSISSGYCIVKHLRQVAQQQEWFLCVQSILAAANLDDENPNFVFTNLHSAESPLDPSLCEKCIFWQDDEQVSEAKRIQRISDRKLMFDLVNAALSEVVAHTSGAKEYRSASSKTVTMAGPLSEEVWGLIKEWSFSKPKICGGESENGLLVENAVREKVVGRDWEDLTRLEVDITGKDIEKQILEEIIDEVLAEIASQGRLSQVGQERCDCRMLETKVRLYRSTRVIVYVTGTACPSASRTCERDLEVKRPSGGDANDALVPSGVGVGSKPPSPVISSPVK